MNKGSQPSVNSCCFSTVVLACREGTTSGLFIPRLILLTIMISGMVVGKVSRSIIISKSLFVSSKLPCRDSQDFLFVRCKGIPVPELGVGLNGTSTSPPFCTAVVPGHWTPSILGTSLSRRIPGRSFVPSALLACTSSAPSYLEHLSSSRAPLNSGMPLQERRMLPPAHRCSSRLLQAP